MKLFAVLASLFCGLASAQLSTVVPPGMTAAQADAAIAAQSSERLLTELAQRKVNPAATPCNVPVFKVGAIACFRNGALVGKVAPGSQAIKFDFDGAEGPNTTVLTSPDAGLSPGGGFFAQVPAALQDGQSHTVKAFVIGADTTPAFDADFSFTWAKGIGPADDGARMPPLSQLVDANLGVWTIRSDTVLLLNGVATNGHATVALIRRGALYAKSPTGGIWYRWMGKNTWTRMTTAEPI